MNPFVQRMGSTRPAALFRIGVVFLLWTRFGDELTPHRDMSPDGLVLGIVFWISTILTAMGLFTTMSSAVVGAVGLYIFMGLGVTWGEDWISHHLWVIVMCSVLVPFTGSGRSYSLDRWLALRRGEAPPERAWQGAMQLVGLQLTAIYFWSAWDKTSWAFLSGMRLQAIFLSLYWENVPREAWVEPLFRLMAVVTVAFEYFIAFGIHWRRLHWWLLPAGILLHVIFYLVLPVTIFTANMILMYLALLDPDEVHRFIDRLQAPPVEPVRPEAAPVPDAQS